MGDKLESEGELLFRQIHPSFIEDGEPSSQPFRPTPKDDNKLSVDRGEISTAQESFELHTSTKGLASVGVYGLTVAEFSSQSIECFSDPIEGSPGAPANPAHAFADYGPHAGSAQKNIAKRLKHAAIARGCLYKP